MIRVGQRHGNSYVSGGLFAVVLYAIFIWPVIVMIKLLIWLIVAVAWACAAIWRAVARRVQ